MSETLQGITDRTYSIADEAEFLPGVQYLQFLLNQFNPGAKLELDGHFGPLTRAIVVQAQLAQGVPFSASDGVCSPELFEWLQAREIPTTDDGTSAFVAKVPGTLVDQPGDATFSMSVTVIGPTGETSIQGELWDTGTGGQMVLRQSIAESVGLPIGAPIGIIGFGGGVSGYASTCDIVLGGVKFTDVSVWVLPNAMSETLGLRFFSKRGLGFAWSPKTAILTISRD